MIPTKHSGYGRDGRRRLHKGGSGGPYYANLDRLYATQAEQADQLMGIANSTVYPGYEQLMAEAQDYGSEANRSRAATQAGADVQAAMGQQRQSMQDNLASMGIDPSDPRYAREMRVMSTQAGAQQAAAMTGARDKVDQMGFARLQDATGMGMGVGSQATAALSAAGQTASTGANLSMQQSQMNANSTANAVRGGIAAANYGSSQGWFADGGYVEPQNFAEGGFVQKLAAGGVVGAMKGIQAAPPPAAAPKQQSATNQVVGAAAPAVGKSGPAIQSAMGGGQSQYALTQGSGQTGLQASASSPESYRLAAEQVNSALPASSGTGGTGISATASTEGYSLTGSGAGSSGAAAAGSEAGAGAAAAGAGEATGGGVLAAEGAGAAGTAAAGEAGAAAGAAVAGEAAAAGGAAAAAGGTGTIAAGGTAAAAGGLGGLGAAGAAIGTAMPWIGAAMLAGAALGLFKDGGQVYQGANNPDAGGEGQGGLGITPGDDGSMGGQVDGPGGPKDDMVPAMLSAGEFVMPVGAVQFFGLDRLEKMRAKGLEYEKQLGIRR